MEVVGAERVTEETVRAHARIEAGQPVTPADVNAALRRLFATGQFSDARMEFQNGTLYVRVQENPSVNQIAFEGNLRISDDALQGEIATRSLEPLSEARANGDARRIVNLYRRLGRYGAAVEPKIIALPNNRVNLVFEIVEGPKTGVGSISFVGNDAWSEYRLRRVIHSAETAWYQFFGSSDIYDPDQLEFDKELLRRFYLSNGYTDFEVLSATAELSPDRTRFFLTFVLSEGDVYRLGEVTARSTTTRVPAEALEDTITISSGDIYDGEAVQKIARQMVVRAGELGFPFVEVNPRTSKDAAANRVDIVFEIAEGPRAFVERINIEGNIRTQDKVIRRELALEEGDAYNPYLAQFSRGKINGLRLFKSIDMQTEPGSAEDRLNMRIRVEEQPTGSINFGIGYSSDDEFGGTVNLTERNVLGRGQQVNLDFNITDDRTRFDARYTEPRLFDREMQASLAAYYTQEDETDSSSYVIERRGLEPSLAFPLSRHLRLTLRGRGSRDDVTAVSSGASPIVSRDLGEEYTTSLGYTLRFDRRDDPVRPRAGYIAYISQDFAGLFGDADYVKTTASATAYFEPYDDVILSLELEGGNVTAYEDYDLRVLERFFLGGSSLRAFKASGVGPRDPLSNDALGANNYGVARAELSFPLGLPEEVGMHGGLFMNAGTLFDLDNKSYRLSNGSRVVINDDPELRVGAGVSFFWASPIGPMRFDFAYPLVEQDEDLNEDFRFSAGTRF